MVWRSISSALLTVGRRTTFPGSPRHPLAYRLQNRAMAGCYRRQGLTYLATQSSFPNNAGYPLYHPMELRYSRSMPAGGTAMQAALMEQPSTQSCERYDLSTLARRHLEHHPHFRGRVNDVF